MVVVVVVVVEVVIVVGDVGGGFQILNDQNVGSVIGADSGPIDIYMDHFLFFYPVIINHYIPQNSVPLATPIIV